VSRAMKLICAFSDSNCWELYDSLQSNLAVN